MSRAEISGAGLTDRSRIDPFLLEELLIAGKRCLALHQALEAVPGDVLDIDGSVAGEGAAIRRRARDREREGMGGVHSHRSRCAEKRFFRDAGRWHNVGDAWLPLGKRAGLVQHNGLDAADCLERCRVLDENIVLGVMVSSTPG